jgi:ABC-type phosphate transport system substrate-binding protein
MGRIVSSAVSIVFLSATVAVAAVDDARELGPRRPAGVKAIEAAAFAEEALAIIVNKANPTDSISLAELRNIFLGERIQWSNGKRITILMREPTPERQAALHLIYRMSEPDFSRHFLHASFIGQTVTPPRQLSSAMGVRRFVVNVPGAIGYVRASDLDGSVKTVKVDGKSHGDPGYKLMVSSS